MNILDILGNRSVLVSISRICNLIKLDFRNETGMICVHIQSALMRGLKNDKLLISSNDIFLPSKNYKKKPFKKFQWDVPNSTLFDDMLSDFKDEIIEKELCSVQYLGKDLLLKFEDNYRVEILACTLEQDREFYRVFKKGDLDSHFVVES